MWSCFYMYNMPGSFYYTNTNNYNPIKMFLTVISVKWAHFPLPPLGPLKKKKGGEREREEKKAMLFLCEK